MAGSVSNPDRQVESGLRWGWEGVEMRPGGTLEGVGGRGQEKKGIGKGGGL